MVTDSVAATYSPSSSVQLVLGSSDGDGMTEVPLSGIETIYNSTQVCPGCGQLMNPLQVIYGNGVCPNCQSRKNAQAVKARMSPNGK